MIDAQFTLARTRGVLAALRRITDKPVSVLVDNHWHDDLRGRTASPPRGRVIEIRHVGHGSRGTMRGDARGGAGEPPDRSQRDAVVGGSKMRSFLFEQYFLGAVVANAHREVAEGQ